MSVQDTVFSQKIEPLFIGQTTSLVMGILNITPDSFFDGGKYNTEEEWLSRVSKMISEGADIIDIGACSTRPGAIIISEQEETERLIPVIKSVRKHFPGTLISADTFRASIAEKAVNAGATIINDISGGTMDTEMFPAIARLQVPYVLMHMQGTPQTMQENPQYGNVTEEVLSFFNDRIGKLKALGFEKIILDPGFGFGKRLEHNYQLLRDLEKFQSFNYPILVGFSRKSMINKILNTKPENALNGTTILNTIALEKGATILRVHDVKEAKEVIKIWEYLKEF
ncbi:MAG: dihydropteroate synthase [Bacteroidetes bacterium]|nr:dihydropteroate synthase [Bacteroidota bacterium]